MKIPMLCVLGLAILLPAKAFASSSPPNSRVNTIVTFTANGNGNTWVNVQLNTSRTNAPCQALYPANFVFRLNSESGRGWLSLLIAAKLANLPVTINGTGSCPAEVTPAYEEVSSLVLGT